MQAAMVIGLIILAGFCVCLWVELDGWKDVADAMHSSLIEETSRHDATRLKLARLQVWLDDWNFNHPIYRIVDLEQLVRTCYVIDADGYFVRFAENG